MKSRTEGEEDEEVDDAGGDTGAGYGGGGPAIAQVSGGLGQESESEDLETNFEVSNEGDYASQCTPALQFGNTGNFNNASSFVQYSGELDDFEPGGIEFAFEPEQETACENTIQQSSAASGS